MKTSYLQGLYFVEDVMTAHWDTSDDGFKEVLDANHGTISFEIEEDGQGFIEFEARKSGEGNYETYSVRAYLSAAQAKQFLAATRAWVDLYQDWLAEEHEPPVNSPVTEAKAPRRATKRK